METPVRQYKYPWRKGTGMTDGRRYPTYRPLARESAPARDRPERSPAVTNLPWVDIHNHAHTLSWNDREKYALSGCQASVVMAAAYYWAPYRPVRPEDVRFLWDDALARMDQIERAHFFDVTVGIGIHTWSRVDDYEDLLAAMPEYCELDEVTAVGEIGITKAQHVNRWDLDDQRTAVREQMEIAREHGLPVVLHTPPTLEEGTTPGGDELAIYETDLDLLGEPVLGDDASLEATRIDLECKDDAGLPDEQLVVSHADGSMVDYVMENSECYLSFTVGYPWLTGVTAHDVAAAIETYGPDRIMVDSDNAGTIKSDFFAIKRTVFELYRMGVDLGDIKQVVYDTPREVFDLDLPDYPVPDV